MPSDALVVSSRQVAENFEKEHRDVLKAIRRLVEGMCKSSQTPSMFHKTTYVNEQNGQTYPMYLMNRDGFSLLAMGFTGSKALEWKLKYIQAFNEMEKTIKEHRDSYMIEDPVERALKWAEEQKEKQKALKALESTRHVCHQGDIYCMHPPLDALRNALRQVAVFEGCPQTGWRS